jgi:ParB family transcriptional regulator, chromosome partitioning protein
MNMAKKGKNFFGDELQAVLGNLADSHDDCHTKINSEALKQLDIVQLIPGSFQPRRNFDDQATQELADSIKAQGILQPLIVKESNGVYEIIVGERRWRAAKLAGLTQVPAVVCAISDETALIYGLIENIQREELNAIEEAHAISRLVTEFSLSHDEVGRLVGKSRASVSNLIRLLALPEVIQAKVVSKELEMGHARAILSLQETDQIKAMEIIIGKGLSVRETERLVKTFLTPKLKNNSRFAARYASQINDWEKRLATSFNTKVQVSINKTGKGRAVIFFDSPEMMEGIVKRNENNT